MTENKVEAKVSKKEESLISVAWLVSGILAVIIIVFISVLAVRGNINMGNRSLSLSNYKTMDASQAKEAVTTYINDTLLAGQATAEISDLSDEKGVYKFTVSLQGQEFDSYVSKDGTMLFPEAFELAASTEETTTDDTTTTPAQEISKTEKATAYLFTMSYCPYGNQAEAAMIPVVDLLGDKANIEPHYVIYDNYNGGGEDYCLDAENKYCSMHGIDELNQDVRELCAYKYDGSDKYWAFVGNANDNCTVDDIETCWEEQATAAGVNVAAVKTCQANEAEELLAAEVALNEKYAISGSPALVINDTEFAGDRTAEGYKAAICSGFTTEPEECATVLGAATDATATDDASCN